MDSNPSSLPSSLMLAGKKTVKISISSDKTKNFTIQIDPQDALAYQRIQLQITSKFHIDAQSQVIKWKFPPVPFKESDVAQIQDMDQLFLILDPADESSDSKSVTRASPDFPDHGPGRKRFGSIPGLGAVLPLKPACEVTEQINDGGEGGDHVMFGHIDQMEYRDAAGKGMMAPPKKEQSSGAPRHLRMVNKGLKNARTMMIGSANFVSVPDTAEWREQRKSKPPSHSDENMDVSS